MNRKWANGHNTEGAELINVLDVICKAAEKFDSVTSISLAFVPIAYVYNLYELFFNGNIVENRRVMRL